MLRRISCALVAGLFAATAPAAHAENGRSIVLVFDASGSMNATLPDGSTRIEAAKAAVADLVDKLPPEERLALRAYGHQSPREAKNCEDTELLVPFDAASGNKAAVLAAAQGIRAQGYTPITHVLRLAAEDVGADAAASRVVVLVSDGKETCGADPCATARALAEADATLVIHTVGLGVDGATRFQLQCIASVARGIYVGADSTAELVAALGQAAEAAAVRETTEIVVAATTGKIRIEGAPPANHAVVDAASGQEVASINTGHPGEVELSAGIYNVQFLNGPWMGVEVRPGETTTLRPGFLQIEGRDLWGNKLLDPETGEAVGETSAGYDRVALLPTSVIVTFANGGTTWPGLVEIAEGATTTLRPGGLQVVHSKPFKHRVLGADGQPVGEVSSAVSRIALPPGSYVLEVGEQRIAVDLQDGQDVEVKVP